MFGNGPRKVPFGFHELVAGRPPRVFLAGAAEKDADFDVSGVRDVTAAAAGVYRLHGAAELARRKLPEGRSPVPAEAREIAYRFLDEHRGK